MAAFARTRSIAVFALSPWLNTRTGSYRLRRACIGIEIQRWAVSFDCAIATL
jgi:hypothetical protein